MLTLDDLKAIKQSLTECKADERDGWGPIHELAEQRRRDALTLVEKEIRKHERPK